MSDLNPEIIRQFEEAMLRAGKSAEEVKAQMELLQASAKKAGMSLDTLDKFNKEVKKNTTTMGGLFTEMISGRKKFKDLTYDLENLNDKIDDMEDTISKANDTEVVALRQAQQSLIVQKQTLQQAVQHNAIQKANIDTLSAFGKGLGQVTSIAGKTLGGFAKGLQDGSSAFGLAGGLMEGAIDGMNAGTQFAATGMTAAGTAMATSVNPRVRAMGMAAQVAGPLLGKLGDAAAAASKFIVGFMMKELESTAEAFNKTSTSGALFADGMTGMRNAAGAAGLTVKQFAGVLEKNSGTIAASGMGVTEGAKRIGGALRAGGDTMKTQMLKLGYGFEEQAELVAETMATMKGSSQGPLKATDAQIAEQTQKYAENLRVISAITGEDAKKKMAQVREQASQLAFQQKLASKSPEQQAAIQRAMANMSDLERKNFMDMVNFGSVINKEGAVAQASSKGLADATAQSYQAWQDGTLDENKQRQITAATQEQRKKDLLAQTGIATAQAAGVSGVVGQVGEAMGKELQYLNKQTPEAIKAAEEAAAAQKNANDDLTNGVVTASEQAQKMAIDLQTLVLPALKDFAKYSGEMLKAIRKQIDDFTGESSGKETWWDKIKDYGSAAASGAMTGASVGAMAGTVTIPGIGTVGGALAGGIAGALGGLGMKAYERNTGPSAAGAGAGSGAATAPPVGSGPPANKQMTLSEFLKFGSGTGDEAHFKLLDTKFQSNFIPMAQEYFAQTGKMLQVNSAFRSLEEQAGVNSGTNPKAAPGKSLHNVGRAADLQSSQVADLQKLGLLGKYGFSPLNGDPPHIQMLDGGGQVEGAEVAIAGEKGPEIVQGPATVTSRSETSDIFKAMNSNLEAMLRVLKEQHSTSEKILRVSA